MLLLKKIQKLKANTNLTDAKALSHHKPHATYHHHTTQLPLLQNLSHEHLKFFKHLSHPHLVPHLHKQLPILQELKSLRMASVE
jgi:hypothetical protein